MLELIEKIINRYGLNIGLDMHQKIYIVDDNYVLNSVKKLITIPGEIGLTIKVGLYTGLRQEEIVHLHKTEVCTNLGGCTCDKLHVIKKPNAVTAQLSNTKVVMESSSMWYNIYECLSKRHP